MSSISPERRPDVGIEYEHPQGSFEQRVSDLIDKRLRDPMTYPTEMRAWLPMWVSTEMQLPVTNVYGLAVLDNYTSSSTADLTLTPSYQGVPGLSITLRQTGVYLIITTTFIQFTVAGAVGAAVAPVLDGAAFAVGALIFMDQATVLTTASRSDILTVSSLSGGGVIRVAAVKSAAGGTVLLSSGTTKVDAVRIGGIGAT